MVQDLGQKWTHYIADHRPAETCKWLGITARLSANEMLNKLLETSAQEFVASDPGQKPQKQNINQFRRKMKSFITSNCGESKLALVAVKMLSVGCAPPRCW